MVDKTFEITHFFKSSLFRGKQLKFIGSNTLNVRFYDRIHNNLTVKY